MNFQQRKHNQLKKQDKSSKHSIDDKIALLCKKINSKQEYYTTSSCAGRILLIYAEEQKKPNLFLFVSHDKITFKQLKSELEKTAKKTKKLIYFKQESCIMHVACKTLKDAQVLLNKAKLAGWKKTGIIASKNRIVAELVSTEKIEMPIINKGKILISDDFLKLLVSEANSKLERTWKKIKNLGNHINL